MKSKLFAALVLMGSLAVSAQNADELRVYINPGHGSWTSNDRPMQVVGKPVYSSSDTDTTGFFESNTDLLKGFGMLEKLIEMGIPFDRTLNQTGERWEIGAAKDLSQNIVMSRVKNGPYSSNNTSSSEGATRYNRNLSEICAEVEYNEFDAFVAIHSNAATNNSTNYHLFMYRGRNGRDNQAVSGSYEMCEAASKYSFPNEHAAWSVSSTYIYGDVDFMGGGSGSTSALGYYGYLGVLKHGVPGYLVEGYFHTHSPSRHRAMNWDVDMIEGYQYARGIAEYFNWEKRDATGEIYGIVRDAHTNFSNAIYIPVGGTDDVLMPLNNTKVLLWKDGKNIAEYTTDEFYNGAFVFKGLEPGTYSITAENDEYLEAEPLEVTVTAGLTSYPKYYLTHMYYNGRPGEDVNYPNLVPDKFSLQSSYELNRHFVDKEIPGLNGMTAKRMIWMKSKLYILALDSENNAKIVVLDGATGQLLATVDTDGCTGNIMNVSDIQVSADGTLIACGKEKLQYSDKYVGSDEVRGNLKFYIWSNDDNGVPQGKPQEWISSQNAAMWHTSYGGDTFAYTGTIKEGMLTFSSVSTSSTQAIRNVVLTIVDGKIDTDDDSRPDGLRGKDLGDDFRYVVSPIDRYKFMVTDNGTTYGMRDYSFNHEASLAAHSESPKSLGTNTLGVGFFKYASNALMTYAYPSEGSTAIKLYDVSRGITAPVEISLTNVSFDSQADNVLTVGYPIATTDDQGDVIAGDFALMMLRDGKLSRFTTMEVDGVQNVIVDTADDSVAVYYDINGRKVNADSLVPGVYIAVKGAKATKIIVK